MRQSGMFAVAGAAVALSATSAMAWVPWVNDNGSGSFFNWSNGGSDNGYFGSPILVGGDTFVFFPSNFRAESSQGVGNPTQRSDRLSVLLEAFSGRVFDSITITEIGDWGINNGGEVRADLGLFVSNLGGPGLQTDTGSFSSNTDGFSTWTISAGVNGLGWDRVGLVLNNDLIAISGADGASFIEKKVTGAVIITVPTPGSLALLGAAGLAAFRRRRR
jgi:hypothetical protein